MIFIYSGAWPLKFSADLKKLLVYSSSSSSSSVRLSSRGRRSQGGFTLNSLDSGVFGACKYEVTMFLFLIGPGCFYLAVLIFYEFLFWLFNGSAKHFVFFLSYRPNWKLRVSFLDNLTCHFLVNLFGLERNSFYVYLYLSMAFAPHEKVVFLHIIICENSSQFPGLLIRLINTTKEGKWQMFLAK